jgi:hypothetical protein
MTLFSRVQFENQMVLRLSGMERGLAARARRRVGYAWRAIVDDMYEKHRDHLTFANQADMMVECAQAVVQLMQSLKDD